MSEENDKIIYLYIPDPDEERRVLTIGRRRLRNTAGEFDNQALEVTYCLNKFVLDNIAFRDENYVPQPLIYDQFSKKQTHRIIEGRFELPTSITRDEYQRGKRVKRFYLHVPEGKSTVRHILEYFAYDNKRHIPRIVASLVEHHLITYDSAKALSLKLKNRRDYTANGEILQKS